MTYHIRFPDIPYELPHHHSPPFASVLCGLLPKFPFALSSCVRVRETCPWSLGPKTVDGRPH